MLDRLILSDRPVEHDALLGVGGSLAQSRAAEPDRFGADQNALGIHAVQDVAKAASFIADAIFDRHLKPVDEHLIGIDRAPSHFLDLAHFDEAAVERGIEQT